MKKIIFFTVILSVFITSMVLFSKFIDCSSSNIKVAIFYPITHDSLEKIKNGFIKEISEYPSIDYDIYNGNGDRMVLRQQAQEILSKKYDLIFTIATSPIVLLSELQKQKGDRTPIIASAGDILQADRNLEEKNILDISIGGSNQQTEEIIDILITTCKPTTVILPYTSTPMIEKQIEKIKEIISNHNIDLIAIPIYNQQEISIKLDHYVKENRNNENQVVFVLQDNMIVAHIEQVINITTKKNCILFTSDLESVDRGGTIGYAVDHDYCGTVSGKQAIDILINQKSIKKIKDIELRDNKLKINYKNKASSLLKNLDRYELITIK